MTLAIIYEGGNLDPAQPRLNTTSTLAQVIAAGWLNGAISEGFVFPADNILMIAHDQGSASAATDYFRISVSSGVYTLALINAVQVGPVSISTALASATPGTVRSLVGAISDSVLMTSGNIVGVRGSVTAVGASGGFLYGAQGKVIGTGTYSGSSWTAGVFGQLDISGATVNAGQMAPIWGDYGTSSGTMTNTTGLRGVVMTNTTAAVLNAQDYRYGNATYLLELAGAGGTLNYYAAAGTSAGSAGDAAHCAAQQVIKIEINGVAAYIPVFTQNT